MVSLSLATLVLAGCKPDASNPPEPSAASVDATTHSDPAPDPAPDQPASSGDSADATAPESEPEPPKRERIRLHNSCSKQVSLRIERVSDSDTNTSLNSSTSMEERATDGDEIRLLDDKNAVIDAITIEASMREIDVAGSCTELQGK